MEITVKKLDSSSDRKYRYDGYEIYIEDHRILTISALCPATASKWIEEVHRSRRNQRRPLLVGVCFDRRDFGVGRGDPKHSPCELLQLCRGSHCLLFRFPDPYCYRILEPFRAFFADPRVIAVSMDMYTIATKLEKDYEIKFSNPMDLNRMAVEGLRRDELDLGRYRLDRLAKVVLGQEMYVIRPRDEVKWFETENQSPYWYDQVISEEKVKFSTLDSYFCFLMGSRLLKLINRAPLYSSSWLSKSKKKKKKKKKKKNKKKKKKKNKKKKKKKKNNKKKKKKKKNKKKRKKNKKKRL